MMASLPISMAPTWESYHPATVDATKCIGRRTSEAKADRRWSCIVYGAFQCTASRPADGSLCADCCLRRARESKFSTEASNWHGVVTDMASMPNWSHIAGSEWFRSGKPKWLGVEKPKGPYVRRSVSAVAATVVTATVVTAPVVTAPVVPTVVAAPVVPTVVPTSTEDQLAATVMCLEEARAELLEARQEIARLKAWQTHIAELAARPPPPPLVSLD
jgi:hypothetical protein